MSNQQPVHDKQKHFWSRTLWEEKESWRGLNLEGRGIIQNVPWHCGPHWSLLPFVAQVSRDDFPRWWKNENEKKTLSRGYYSLLYGKDSGFSHACLEHARCFRAILEDVLKDASGSQFWKRATSGPGGAMFGNEPHQGQEAGSSYVMVQNDFFHKEPFQVITTRKKHKDRNMTFVPTRTEGLGTNGLWNRVQRVCLDLSALSQSCLNNPAK